MWTWIVEHWLTQEKFWVALGAIVTATTLAITITKENRNLKSQKRNVRESLYLELLTNMDSLFNGGIERPFLDNAMLSLQRNWIYAVKSPSHFLQLQSLYVELYDFRAVVENQYLKTDTGHYIVTEKQINVIDKFLVFFGEKPVLPDTRPLRFKQLQDCREEAKAVRNKNINKWERVLRTAINETV